MAMAALNANPVFAAAAAKGAGASPPSTEYQRETLDQAVNKTINSCMKKKVDSGMIHPTKCYGIRRTFEVPGMEETDLTIHSEDCVFHVHRFMLSLASPVWNRMLNGPFAESTSDIIVFEEDNPLALNYVLGILYCPEEFSQHSNPHLNLNMISRGSETDIEAGNPPWCISHTLTPLTIPLLDFYY